MKRRGFLSGLGGLLGAVGLGMKPDVPEPKPPKPDEQLIKVAIGKHVGTSPRDVGWVGNIKYGTVETIELPGGWVRISQTT